LHSSWHCPLAGRLQGSVRPCTAMYGHVRPCTAMYCFILPCNARCWCFPPLQWSQRAHSHTTWQDRVVQGSTGRYRAEQAVQGSKGCSMNSMARSGGGCCCCCCCRSAGAGPTRHTTSRRAMR
jgi:hypothetical protein